MVKIPPANVEDSDSVPRLEGSPGEGSNPLQCSYLGNPRDRGTWCGLPVHGAAKS